MRTSPDSEPRAHGVWILGVVLLSPLFTQRGGVSYSYS